MSLYASQLIEEKHGDLFEENVWIKDALHTRHVAFKSKIQWYLAKQMTKVSNKNSNQFHHCHGRNKDLVISLILI